jgi:hypothetical protein
MRRTSIFFDPSIPFRPMVHLEAGRTAKRYREIVKRFKLDRFRSESVVSRSGKRNRRARSSTTSVIGTAYMLARALIESAVTAKADIRRDWEMSLMCQSADFGRA